MRLKFRQDDIDVVIAVTNVHYCKHQSAVYGYNPNDETDEFGNIYKCGLSVLQQDVTQTMVMLFVGISKMDCNDIVEELLMEKKDYTVTYTEDAIRMMDERMILKSDVERVLADYRESQEAVLDEETKELVARSRLGNVTFWVRFIETEEGYLVRRAYSHRMNIMKRVGQ